MFADRINNENTQSLIDSLVRLGFEEYQVEIESSDSAKNTPSSKWAKQRAEEIKIFNITSKEDQLINADYILFFYGLNKKLGPINNWNLELAGSKIKVNTENFQTDKEGIFAVGDINTYPGKLNLILSGFHETTLAVQKAFQRVHPGERVPFGYTTSSTKIHEKLGFSEDK